MLLGIVKLSDILQLPGVKNTVLSAPDADVIANEMALSSVAVPKSDASISFVVAAALGVKVIFSIV